MKIYFAGSIKGGRGDSRIYLEIINYLKKYGEVLTEHVGSIAITDDGENIFTDEFIYSRDMDWLTCADVVVADVSIPSLGVGYEIACAENLNKKILCLYRNGSEKKLSSMIAGCEKITIEKYDNMENVIGVIDNFFDKNKKL